MGKVIEFPAGKKGNPLVSQANAVYMEALEPLVKQARRLAKEYGYPTKDVLTDALVLDVRDSLIAAVRDYDDGGDGTA